MRMTTLDEGEPPVLTRLAGLDAAFNGTVDAHLIIFTKS